MSPRRRGEAGWRIRRGDAITGPYGWNELVELIDEDELWPADLVRGPADEAWRPAREVGGLFKPTPEQLGLPGVPVVPRERLGDGRPAPPVPSFDGSPVVGELPWNPALGHRFQPIHWWALGLLTALVTWTTFTSLSHDTLARSEAQSSLAFFVIGVVLVGLLSFRDLRPTTRRVHRTANLGAGLISVVVIGTAAVLGLAARAGEGTLLERLVPTLIGSPLALLFGFPVVLLAHQLLARRPGLVVSVLLAMLVWPVTRMGCAVVELVLPTIEPSGGSALVAAAAGFWLLRSGWAEPS
ncbi:MAG: hypothetical protein AAF533_18440 [Acidobacteriota bacterium]